VDLNYGLLFIWVMYASFWFGGLLAAHFIWKYTQNAALLPLVGIGVAMLLHSILHGLSKLPWGVEHLQVIWLGRVLIGMAAIFYLLAMLVKLAQLGQLSWVEREGGDRMKNREPVMTASVLTGLILSLLAFLSQRGVIAWSAVDASALAEFLGYAAPLGIVVIGGFASRYFVTPLNSPLDADKTPLVRSGGEQPLKAQ